MTEPLRCKDCGRLAATPTLFTGKRPCDRVPGIFNIAHPEDVAVSCARLAPRGTLEGELAALALAMGKAALSVGLLSGSNVGTVDDPRFEMPHLPKDTRKSKG